MAPRMNLPTLTPTPRQTCAVGTGATCPGRVDRHETDSPAAPILNVAKDNQLSMLPATPQGDPRDRDPHTFAGRAGGPAHRTGDRVIATHGLLGRLSRGRRRTGRYYEDCTEAPVLDERSGHTGGVAPYAVDHDNADRLWQISLELAQQ